jgi:membrane protein YdbS with pleckstrin-like domain
MALYVQVCWLCPLIALSNEVGFDGQNSWENLALAETGFEAVICLLWMAMMVYSCMAVHKWRMAKKSGAIKMGAMTRGERNLEEQSA